MGRGGIERDGVTGEKLESRRNQRERGSVNFRDSRFELQDSPLFLALVER
jgi:hypothetical protein